jgi:plastocyanin
MLHKPIQSTLLLLGLLLFSLGSALTPPVVYAAPPPAARCFGFEDLPFGAEWQVGDGLYIAHFAFGVEKLIAADGSEINDGHVKVTNGLQAGGSGKELQVNNVNLAASFPVTLPIAGLKLRFGEYGGNLNVTVNGDFRNVANFSDLYGSAIGGVNVNGTGGNGNDHGALELTGAITSFAIGGQELFLDDLCPIRQTPQAGADLGDAPDSTNHLGLPNTAYPAASVSGQFPTVWQDPTGAASGPKHLNQQLEAWLGDHLSGEEEADQGADQDTVHNILNSGLDLSNLDHGDDGWLNRNAPFPDCQETTLKVRVSKSTAATVQTMYLNVWFDGTRDGDWADAALCNVENQAARRSEWIVQNFAVHVAAIPAGGFMDLAVNTRLVLNEGPDQPHWLRFTLSEQPAVTPAAGALADGRGPQHPNAFALGESEDYLQLHEQQGEPGQLAIDKSVATPRDPVQPGDLVTFTIRLEHQGGTAPLPASLVDELPGGLQLAGPVQVVEEASQVSPLHAHMERHKVGWRGVLSPTAKLNLTFPVRVLACYDGQLHGIKNVATAKRLGGITISDEAVFNVQCSSAGSSDVALTWSVQPIERQPEGPEADAANVQMESLTELVPGVPVRVIATLTNHGQEPLQLGFVYQKIEWLLVDGADDALTASSLQERRDEDHPRSLAFVLEPGQSRQIERLLDFAHFPGAQDELLDNLDKELVAVVDAVVCLLNDRNGRRCPDPQQEPGAPFVPHSPLHLPVRFADLGDAPDSTNHFTQTMAAYPSVQANFPTVYDPATGLPQGPRHNRPQPFHLGKFVSPESGVDVGLDADWVHNLLPPLNKANLDGHDDGIRPASLTFSDCQRSEIEVAFFISPRAVAYFKDTGKPGYLNVWVDGNRDGDWADATQCPPADNLPTAALEHIVIDHAVDVATLGAGLHLFKAPTGRVPWPVDGATNPAWLRLTLSEAPADKPLTTDGIVHGDGRGHLFKLGETEDYLLRDRQPPTDGADVAIRKEGHVRQEFDLETQRVHSKIVWQIEYANRGDALAEGVVIHDRLANGADVNELLLGVRTIPTIPYAVEGNQLVFRPGELEPGRHGRIFLVIPARLDISTTATITNVAVISASNDVNNENNRAVAQVTVGLRAPRIITPVDGSTCSENVEVTGRAEAGAAVDLYVDDVLATTLTADEQGRWSHNLTLAAGAHRLHAVARLADQTSTPSPTVVLIVDPTLSYDPISLQFMDGRGHVRRPMDENGRTDAEGWSLRLHPNATYSVSVRICCEEANASAAINIADVGLVELSDPDGDHIFTGSFSTGPRDPTPGDMSLTVTCGDNETTANGQVVLIDPAGVVYDAITRQPLAQATVACMEGQATSAGATPTTAFTLWNAADYGNQVNPQSTLADGQFSFLTPAGLYQLVVSKPGYQPYRSTAINVVDEPVRYDTPLTPILTQAANQVIEVSEAGFNPAVLTVTPGAVVEWVNVGSDSHTSTSSNPQPIGPASAAGGWDSGLLAAGESYKLQLTTEGTYIYQDNQNPANTATIIVQPSAGGELTEKTFLPLVAR